MILLHNSTHKLKNIVRTIDALSEGDFPLSSGQNALLRLRKVFEELERKLARAHKLNDSDALKGVADNINLKILRVLPILGFILRSTNVRNAFELLEPLQSIADAVLQGKPQLLLSSEWDYVPFAYPQNLEDLKSYVLIGLPASEAASALLVPLAGHELGHAIWRNRGFEGEAATTLQLRCDDLYSNDMNKFKSTFPDYNSSDIVSRDILPTAIGESVDYAVHQAEELFCDLFAYAIFGASYLHAFAYILAPSVRICDPTYPLHDTRISVIAEVARREGQSLPTAAELSLGGQIRGGDLRDRYVVSKAETSVSGITNALWERASKVIQEADLRRPSEALATRHLKEFGLGIPAHAPVCLGDVINARWARYEEIRRSAGSTSKVSDGLDHLNEVLLKTIEVLEYHRRVYSAT